jgi:acetyl esterase/lipase
MKLQSSHEKLQDSRQSCSRNVLLAAGLLLLQGCGLDSSTAGETQVRQQAEVFESEISPLYPSSPTTVLSSIETPVEVTSTADLINVPETTVQRPKASFEIVPMPTTNELFTAEKNYTSFYHKIEPATIWYGQEQHQKYVLYESPIDYHKKTTKQEDTQSENPIVVFAYGGGFVEGDTDALKSVSPGILAMVDYGFDIVAIDYRKTDVGKTFPTAYEDAIDALQNVMAAAPNRDVVLAGVSAGGTLAYILGTPNAQIPGVSADHLTVLRDLHLTGRIKSVIATNPPTTESWRGIGAFMPWMTPSQRRAAMPIGLAEQGLCPNNLYLITSSLDTATPPETEALPLFAATMDNCPHSTTKFDPTDIFHGLTFWPVEEKHFLGDGTKVRATNYASMLAFIEVSLDANV